MTSSPRLPLGPDEFAQGVTPYSDKYPGDVDNRIVLWVTFGNSKPTPAIVDTAGPWCILGPEEAEALGIDFQIECEKVEKKKGLLIRGILYGGWRCRIPVSLEAEEGFGITLDATAFIPDIAPLQQPIPNFVGLGGFLDRIRFAVDPENNLFYFGLFGEDVGAT